MVFLAISRLSGRHSHHLEPVHTSGAAVCLCALRSAFFQERAAAAGGNGGHLHAGGQPGGRGRGMGRPRQSVWADCRADSLGIFGLTLLFASLAERLSRPFVQLGSKLSGGNDSRPGLLRSFLLGIATGLLWTPCAGPILGLILTGAALSGASTHTVILLLAYAAGAATSLALALLAGGRETVGAVCLGGGHRVRRCTGCRDRGRGWRRTDCERLSQEDRERTPRAPHAAVGDHLPVCRVRHRVSDLPQQPVQPPAPERRPTADPRLAGVGWRSAVYLPARRQRHRHHGLGRRGSSRHLGLNTIPTSPTRCI